MSTGMLKRIYPGSASLIQDIGKSMLVYLRGGRSYIGILRTVDQFGNLVLNEAFERIYVGAKFCDVPQGILLIRGENIILIGELNDFNVDDKLERVAEQEIYSLQAEQIATRKSIAKMRTQLYVERGLLHDIGELCFDDG